MSSIPLRIDAHHHLWDLEARDQPWIDPQRMGAIRRSFAVDDLAGAVSKSGVTATILVQVLNRCDETDELLATARESPLIVGVVAWADLSRPDLPDELYRMSRRGPLVGIRHQLQAEAAPADWLRRGEVRAGLASICVAGLPFDLMIRPEQFDVALNVVRAHPGLAFVIDHLGKPPIATGQLEPWTRGLRSLAREPNVTAKLSGLTTVANHGTWSVEDLRPYVDVALTAFGPSRLMFGSDWPQCLLAGDYGVVIDAIDALIADLTPAEQDDIWSATARRVYSVCA